MYSLSFPMLSSQRWVPLRSANPTGWKWNWKGELPRFLGEALRIIRIWADPCPCLLKKILSNRESVFNKIHSSWGMKKITCNIFLILWSEHRRYLKQWLIYITPVWLFACKSHFFSPSSLSCFFSPNSKKIFFRNVYPYFFLLRILSSWYEQTAEDIPFK